ncbi:hypothetical protein LTR53_008133 [Teratosphaeriaceae sp. CCFEE 6253]|nr:hypothetical protein LTR53_008133 [Teratosphaeriaceae sp. CCFEE 6253]
MPPKSSVGAVKRPAAPAASSAQPAAKAQRSLLSFFGPRGNMATAQQSAPAESSTPANPLLSEASLPSALTGGTSNVRTEQPAGLPVPASGEVSGAAVDPVEDVEASEPDHGEEQIAPITREDLVDAGLVPHEEMTAPVAQVTVTEVRSSASAHGPAPVSAAVSAAAVATSLCLRSILLYAVQAVLDELPGFLAADAIAPFMAVTAVALVEYALAGMPADLVTYLDQCLAKGQPWDIFRFMELLHPRDTANGKIGCYFIGLVKSDLVDFKVNPTKKVYCGALFYLPLNVLASYGTAPIQILETARIGLFATPHTKSLFVKRTGLLNALLPAHLLNCFRTFLGAYSNGLVPSQVMAQALARACRGTYSIVSCNHTAPVTELVRSAGLERLLNGGLQRPLHREAQSEDDRLPTVWVTLLCDAKVKLTHKQYSEMLSAGLDLDNRSNVTVELTLSDDYDEQNFAQVPADGDFEEAGRIRFIINFLRADDEIVSYVVQKAKKGTNLKRACFAMTVYEYAQGILPRDVFGPRRINLNATRGDALRLEPGLKAWKLNHVDPEKPFRCRECGYRTNQKDLLQMHLGLQNAAESKNAEKCRTSEKWGKKLMVSKDLTLALALPPGHVAPATPHPILCRACGTLYGSTVQLRAHLGVDTKGTRRDRSAACKQKYEAHEFDLSDHGSKLSKANTGDHLPLFE